MNIRFNPDIEPAANILPLVCDLITKNLEGFNAIVFEEIQIHRDEYHIYYYLDGQLILSFVSVSDVEKQMELDGLSTLPDNLSVFVLLPFFVNEFQYFTNNKKARLTIQKPKKAVQL